MVSEETKKKIRESNTGQKRTEETRRKMSEAQKKRYEDPEERKKISRELHDRVAQTLIAVNVKLAVLRKDATVNIAGLKKTLAAGADELILLEDEQFVDLDSRGTALALARAIEKIGDVDLILCGRQAADTDAGQVGIGIAAMLDIPAITLAQKVEVKDGTVRVERLVAEGYEVVETALPALVTASNEVGELRFPPVKAVIAAQKIQPTIWSAEELGVDLAGSARVDLVRFFVPERKVQCQLIEGGSPEEIAEGIAAVLKTRVA